MSKNSSQNVNKACVILTISYESYETSFIFITSCIIEPTLPYTVLKFRPVI